MTVTTLHLCLLLAVIACLIGAGLGLVALLRPHRVLKMVGLSLTEGVGQSLSEVRATYGGLFFVSPRRRGDGAGRPRLAVSCCAPGN